METKKFPSDIEISRNAILKPIAEIAANIGIKAEDLIPYGKYKAKIPLNYLNEEKIKKYADLFCKVLSLIEEKYMEKLRMNRLQATMNELKLKRIEHMYKHFGFARSAYQ